MRGGEEQKMGLAKNDNFSNSRLTQSREERKGLCLLLASLREIKS
jgi:hypothetical protein